MSFELFAATFVLILQRVYPDFCVNLTKDPRRRKLLLRIYTNLSPQTNLAAKFFEFVLDNCECSSIDLILRFAARKETVKRFLEAGLE